MAAIHSQLTSFSANITSDKATNHNSSDFPRNSTCYTNSASDFCAFFGSDLAHCLPTTLNLEGQSYFALGYHQMCTQITGEIRKRIAEKQEG